MFKILLLICPIALDRAACGPDNAINVVRATKVASAQQCAFMGQAMLAPTTIAPVPAKTYLKILCVADPNAKDVSPSDGQVSR